MTYTFLGVCLILLSPAFGYNKTTCECGWKNPANFEISQPIYGGTDTMFGEWPFSVYIKFQFHTYPRTITNCAGMIITKRHVLSAAHCIKYQNATATRVYYNVDLKNGVNPFKTALKHYTHENYVNVLIGTIAYPINDIGIILIDGEFPFDQRVGPACLSKNRVPDGETITALGWGYVDSKGNHKNRLQIVELKTRNSTQCFDVPLLQGMPICIDSIGKNVCQGDSGGPILWYDNKIQRYFLVGVVSFEKDRSKIIACPSRITGSADVSMYINWINEKIKLDTDVETCTPI